MVEAAVVDASPSSMSMSSPTGSGSGIKFEKDVGVLLLKETKGAEAPELVVRTAGCMLAAAEIWVAGWAGE